MREGKIEHKFPNFSTSVFFFQFAIVQAMKNPNIPNNAPDAPTEVEEGEMGQEKSVATTDERK